MASRKLRMIVIPQGEDQAVAPQKAVSSNATACETETKLKDLASRGNRQAMYDLGLYYKAKNMPDQAGYWLGKVKLFPEFDFIEFQDDFDGSSNS